MSAAPVTKSAATTKPAAPMPARATPASTAAQKALGKKTAIKPAPKKFDATKNPLSQIPKAVALNVLGPMLGSRDIAHFRCSYKQAAKLPLASTIIRNYRLEPLLERYLHVSKKELGALNESGKNKVLAALRAMASELSNIEKMAVPSYKNLDQFFEELEARNLMRMMTRLREKRPELDFSGIKWTSPPEKSKEGCVVEAQGLRIWIESHKEQLSKLNGELDLIDSRLSLLPKEIGQLVALKMLYLDDNRLVALPKEIGQLVALQQLYLHNNRLVALPKEIGQLVALEWFSLISNRLVALPKEISQLKALQQLFLQGNRLIALPEEIGQLKALHMLFLQGNGLIDLPENLKKYELQLAFQNKKLQLLTILHRLTLAIQNKANKKTLTSLLAKIDSFNGKEIRSKLHQCLSDICNKAWKKKDPLREKFKDPHFGSKAFLDPLVDPKLKLAAIELFKRQLEQENKKTKVASTKK